MSVIKKNYYAKLFFFTTDLYTKLQFNGVETVSLFLSLVS